MKYLVARAMLAIATVGLVTLGVWSLFLSSPVLHVGAPRGSHQVLNMRWIGAWALYAAFLSWTGTRYCRIRADDRPPTPDERLLFSAAGVSIVVGGVFAFACMLAIKTIA